MVHHCVDVVVLVSSLFSHIDWLHRAVKLVVILGLEQEDTQLFSFTDVDIHPLITLASLDEWRDSRVVSNDLEIFGCPSSLGA